MTDFTHIGCPTRYQMYKKDVDSLCKIIDDLYKSKKNRTKFNKSLVDYYNQLNKLKVFDDDLDNFKKYGDLEKRLFCLYTPDGQKHLISISFNTTYCTIWNMTHSLLGIEKYNIIGNKKHINNVHLYMTGNEEPIKLGTPIIDMLPNNHDILTITPIFVIIEITITEISSTPYWDCSGISSNPYIDIKKDIIPKIEDTLWDWESLLKKLELDDLQINSSDIIIRNNFAKNKKHKNNVFYNLKQNAKKHNFTTPTHKTNSQRRALRN